LFPVEYRVPVEKKGNKKGPGMAEDSMRVLEPQQINILYAIALIQVRLILTTEEGSGC
jgi:hypothetical protein